MFRHQSAAKSVSKTSAGPRGLLVLLLACAGLGFTRTTIAAGSPPTFNRDIAPLLHRHCAPCHRPGEAGPFPLLTFAEARKHATDLVNVTASRRMPPWLPDEGAEVFPEARRLSAAEIERLRAWVEAGTPEGRPEDLPPPPKFTPGWQLGPPDLMVTFPTPYELAAEGADVFRNLVAPLPVTSNRFVRTIEFRPGNRSVHHARLVLDTAGKARRKDGADGQPGFPGPMLPGQDPPGFMLAWAPGRAPSPGYDGLSWPLNPGTDLIVGLHLQRTGKRELVQPTIGFYFADRPPTNTPVIMGLDAMSLDIPPGATNYAVDCSLTLPVAADLLTALPHAHYLGKEMIFRSTAPGSPPVTRLHIRDWDFNWQLDYRYGPPVPLAAGTRLDFRWTFDNSAANPRNPSRPPRRVLDGWQTAEEMAQLWLQLLPRDAAGGTALKRAFDDSYRLQGIAFFQEKIRRNPTNAVAHFDLGRSLLELNRLDEAFEHLATADELQPGDAEFIHYLGTYFVRRNQLAAARDTLERALAANPRFHLSHLVLGQIALAQGELDEAESRFRTVLDLDPGDPEARAALESVAARRNRK